MQSAQIPLRAIPIVAAFLLPFGVATPASAGDRAKERYVFELFKIERKRDDMPVRLENEVKKRLLKVIDTHEALAASAGEDAPDPGKEPDAYERYLKKKNMRAFKVNVEILEYEYATEEVEGKRAIRVRVSLRMFGETIPGRVMMFTGEGSATLRIDVGKKVRKKDVDYAHKEAIQLSVGDAVQSSITKLRAGAEPEKKKKKAKKTRKNK